jgi:hypothetical protein
VVKIEGSGICSILDPNNSILFLRRADAAGRANVDTQRGIVVAVAFRTGGAVYLEKDLAGTDRFGRADRLAVTAGGAHIGVDFHCHDV